VNELPKMQRDGAFSSEKLFGAQLLIKCAPLNGPDCVGRNDSTGILTA